MADLCHVLLRRVEGLTVYTTIVKRNYRSAIAEVGQDYPSRRELSQHVIETPALTILGDVLPYPSVFAKVFLAKSDLLIVLGSESIGSLLLSLTAKARGTAVIPIAEKNLDNRSQLPRLVRTLSTAKRFLAKMVHRRAGIIIAESNATQDYLIELGCSPNRIHVYPHGVNTLGFRPQEPDYEFARRIGISEEDLGRTSVLFPNGFRTNKGIGYFAEACKSNSLREFIFLVVEYGAEISSYKPVLQGCHNVRFIPLIQPEDMVNLYSISDIVIIPSITALVADISPNVLLEAMACGKAVIASNIGGIPDMLGNCGILIPERDAEAIVEAIVKLAYDVQLRAHYGRVARQRAESVLSIEQYADTILELYTTVIGSRKRNTAGA